MFAAHWLTTALVPTLLAAPLALGGVVPAPTAALSLPGVGAAVDSIEPPAADRAAALGPDFNGDGYADLATGVPTENGASDDTGEVSVIYGSSTGLSAAGNELWSQDSSGVLDAGDNEDLFGSALGWSDFDGDGFDDLAIGVPGEQVGTEFEAGAVNVLYGSATGLTSTGNQFWTQDSPGVKGESQSDDLFGQALVGRDFDSDGFGDLVIGAPGDGNPSGSGTALVLYGTSSGLDASRNQKLVQLTDNRDVNDGFGETVAAGDFNGDGIDDLVIGVPNETVAQAAQGAVNVMYGSPSGLVKDGNQFWHQDSTHVPGDAADFEWFGSSLSVADFDGDSFDDLAIGISSDDVGTADAAGSTQVLYGSGSGLTASGSQLWNQDTPGVLGTASTGDWNADVVAADFDADGYGDLVMGFPQEDLRSIPHVGMVNVLYGTASGLGTAGNQVWSQYSTGVEDEAEDSDYFGRSLTSGDFDRDGSADLAVGVPQERVGTIWRAGAVNVLYGGRAGISAAGDQFWSQDTSSVLGTSEAGDGFSSALHEG